MLEQRLSKLTLAFAFVLGCGVTLASAQVGRRDESSDQQAIRRCWAGYRRAVLARQGRAALPLVSKESIGYYGRIRQLALTGTEAETRELPIMDKIVVLLARDQLRLERLRAMSAGDVFVYAVNQGWIDGKSTRPIGIGQITVTGATASGQLTDRAQPTTEAHRFIKEDNRWKLDPTSYFAFANTYLTVVVAQEGFDEDEFALFTVYISSKKRRKVSANIWQPLVK